MSTVTPDEQTTDAGHDAHGHDDHGHHDHPDYVAHHFDSSQQQFDAGKLGIWLFLAQEVLFFSGLFVFYVYIKTLKPEAFEYAHSFLEVKYGLINTIVLITSSLTMAWGVRCASLNQKTGLKICLGLTLLGAFGFLGVKSIEYTNKWHHGLYWGKHYSHHKADHPFPPPIQDEEYAAHLAELGKKYDNPQDAGLYFTVYYCMTGLHAIHVIAGIVVIFWLFIRALKEEFHSDYFGPVDYVGLYWHLVDLVWIFLFPMLYLVR